MNDAVIVHVFGPEVGTFMTAIRDVGWKNVIIVGDPGTTPFIDLQAVVPKEVQGQLYFPQYKGASREGDTAALYFFQVFPSEIVEPESPPVSTGSSEMRRP